MKWNVENLGPSERKITIEIPTDTVGGKFSELYKDIGKNAAVKGFRKGKVPRGILKQYYGTRVAEEVGEALIQDSLGHALQEADLEPTGNFSVERGDVIEGDAYSYTALFDVMVLPTGIALSHVNAARESSDVPNDEIEERLKLIQNSRAELVPVEDRGAKDEDMLTIDYEGMVDGEPLPGASGEQQTVTIGAEGLLPGLSDGLCGLKMGEERDIEVTLPAMPAEEEGEDTEETPERIANFHVVVHKIMEREIPALDDDFAVDVGFDDLAALRKRVQDDLTTEKKRTVDQGFRQAALSQLIDTHEFDVPESMIESRTQELMKGFFNHLKQQGINPEQLGEVTEEQMKTFREQAERLGREQVLLKAIAAENSLDITDENLEERYATMAGEMGKEVDEVREMMVSSGATHQLKTQLLEEKVLSFIEANASAPSPAEATTQDTVETSEAAEDQPRDDEPSTQEEE